MAEGTNKLGESVIEVRADISKLPGDLAAAREMVDKATAKPADATGNTPGKSPVSPAIDEASKVPEKVKPAVDTWNEYNGAVTKTEPIGRSFVQTIRNQTQVLTGFIGTLTAAAAAIYSAYKVGALLGDVFFNNTKQLLEYNRAVRDQAATESEINSILEKRARLNLTALGIPDESQDQLLARGRRSTTKFEESQAKLAEFDSSSTNQAATSLIGFLLNPFLAIYKMQQRERLEAQMNEDDSSRADDSNQRSSIQRRTGRHAARANQQDDVTFILKENNQIQGEQLKTMRQEEASRPR